MYRMMKVRQILGENETGGFSDVLDHKKDDCGETVSKRYPQNKSEKKRVNY